MRTMHRIFDVNNDGVISFDDFVLLAETFGKLGLLSNKEMEEFLAVMKVRSIYFDHLSAHQSLFDILVDLGIKLGRNHSVHTRDSRAISHGHASRHD